MAGGVVDGGVHLLPRVLVHQRDVTPLGAEDLGERADVQLAGVGAGGGADPDRWRRQTVRCGGR